MIGADVYISCYPCASSEIKDYFRKVYEKLMEKDSDAKDVAEELSKAASALKQSHGLREKSKRSQILTLRPQTV